MALLLGLLGFAAVIQVRSLQEDGPLESARQGDLVQILDDLDNRSERLRAEIGQLEQTRRELTSGTDQVDAALADARRRAQLLGVLAGTIPARGPGLELTITDPESRIGAEVLLDAVQELRAAGAEAMQLEAVPADEASGTARTVAVRIVAETYFAPAGDGVVEVDGTRLRAAYRFTVIGDGATMEAALGIPGGVVDYVASRAGKTAVRQTEDARVSALRPLRPARYARPS